MGSGRCTSWQFGQGLGIPYTFLRATILRSPSATPCTWRSRRLCSRPLLQRDCLFARSKRNCATSARITTQCIGNEQGENLPASRRKLHHHRRRTFSLRGSVAPATFHGYSVYSFTAIAERGNCLECPKETALHWFGLLHRAPIDCGNKRPEEDLRAPR